MKPLDAGQAEVDKLVEVLEKKIKREYSRTAKKMERELLAYLKQFEKKDKHKRQELDNGLITKKQYQQWRTRLFMSGQKWQDILDVLAEELDKCRRRTLRMSNDIVPQAFAIGMNFGTYLIETGLLIDTAFKLYTHKDVVIELAKYPSLLPAPSEKVKREIRERKIKKWNRAKMNSTILRGIILGRSISEIAKMLRSVVQMSHNASVRNARTMTGAAESMARQRSFERAEKKGIKMKKQWVATLDERTRVSHVEINGEWVAVKENFSNGLKFPRDPKGKPAEVYNCRCTMVPALEGFEKNITDYDLTKNKKLNGMTYEQWKEERLNADRRKRQSHA